MIKNNKKNEISSKAIGLDFGLSVGRFFLNSEDLHYGYWPNNKVATVQNLVEAQNAHSQLIINNIPAKIKNILDVGSGSGSLALKLLQLNYNVDCVVPSQFLADQISNKLNDRGRVHVCNFEKCPNLKKYDLILFSESFQYVKLKESFLKINELINPSGYVLICDFFQRDLDELGPLGGGHNWNTFLKIIEDVSLTLVKDIDITNETAPTIDLFAKFNNDVLLPFANMSSNYLIDRYPKITKFLKWKFKRRIKKISNIYLSGAVNGENFKKFKEYHLLVYKHLSK